MSNSLIDAFFSGSYNLGLYKPKFEKPRTFCPAYKVCRYKIIARIQKIRKQVRRPENIFCSRTWRFQHLNARMRCKRGDSKATRLPMQSLSKFFKFHYFNSGVVNKIITFADGYCPNTDACKLMKTCSHVVSTSVNTHPSFVKINAFLYIF